MPETIRVTLTQGQVALVDADDWPTVSKLRWHASWAPKLRSFYAVTGTTTADGRRTSLYMHRLITGAPKGKEVDHINHDTLDNRRANLRVGSHQDNQRNGRWALTTHCPRGHPYDLANTHVTQKGKRVCRTCAVIRTRAVLAAETPAQRERRRVRQRRYYERYRSKILADVKDYTAKKKLT